MGGGRKGKASSSTNRGGSHHRSSPQLLRKRWVVEKFIKVDDQLQQLLEEQVTLESRNRSLCKDLIILAFLFFMMALASLGLSLAAGTAISVHFYEQRVPSSWSSKQQHQYRITSLDNDIIKSHNAGKGAPRGPAVTVHHEDAYSEVVVEEMTPLHLDFNGTTLQNATQGIILTEATIRPTLCSDGVTMGFDDWNTLKSAIREANSLSAEKFLRWNEYLSKRDSRGPLVDPSLYYEQDVFFTICPGVTLKARKGPIYINAENIVIECEECTIDVGGTHLSFGPHARNVLVRGLTFKGAQHSSMAFYHDGSEAMFEDCYWYGNAGIGKAGAVADVNSTRFVSIVD